MSFQYHFNKDGTELLLKVDLVSFDAAQVLKFRKSLDESVKKKPSRVTIDLESVHFIDSSGIGALIGIQKRVKSNSEPITLINTQLTVKKVIELLRLHRVFNLK